MSQKFKTSVDVSGSLTLSTIDNSTINTGKFIVSDNGVIKYRTASELLSDIGAQSVITNPVTGTGTTNYLSKFTASGTIGNSLIYDNGTNVGIGTISPNKQLTFAQAADDPIQIRRLTTSQGNPSIGTGISWTWADSSSDNETWAAIRVIMPGNGNSNMTFSTTPGSGASSLSERMRITDAGYVGIGTTSPSAKLDVNGGIISNNKNYFHNQFGGQPTISVAIGDYDTGFNWEGDGVISYYSNGVEQFNFNNVWHSGNFNPSDYVTTNTIQNITASKVFYNGLEFRSNVYGKYSNGADALKFLIQESTDRADIYISAKTGGASIRLSAVGDIPVFKLFTSGGEVMGNGIASGSPYIHMPMSTARFTLRRFGDYLMQYAFVIGGDGIFEGNLVVTNNITAPTFSGNLNGNAATATTLQTARTINGTSFNGSANITTANWGTGRTITIGSTGKTVDGSGNVSWTLAEIGAQAAGSYAASSHTHDDRYYTESESDAKYSLIGHVHDDRYYTETEINEITHHWEWRWIRWAGYFSPAGGSAAQWTDYYKAYFTERSTATEAAYGEQSSGYVNTITNVGTDGGFGGSTYGNIFGNLESYHCLIYTNIYVDKAFTVSITNFNGDDPHAIFIDGVFVHGNTSCCADTAYTYTFTQGWHRIDLIYSEGGGGDWIRMGWNPKDYTSNIKDVTPHRAGENPRNVFDKIKALDGAGSGLDADLLDGNHASAFYLASNPSGYTANAGTVTSVSGTGSYGGLTLSGTVTGSGSLTLGGTPSGTWPISITGSSGSVSGLTLNNSGSPINPDNVTQNQIGYNTNVSLFGQIDGGLYSSAYSSSWIHQIYGDFRTGQIAVRGKNNGVWQSWRRVLDETNFSTWAATSAQGTKADSAYGWGNHASAGYALASGTVNYIPKFTASGTLGNSLIYDNGTSVGIGTNTPTATLEVSSSNYTGIAISRSIQNAGVYIQAKGYDTGNIYRVSSQITFDQVSDTFWVNGGISFATASSGSLVTRWKILTDGTFQSNGAGKIETSASNLTLNAPFGDIYLVPQSTKNVGIGTTTPSPGYKLDVNGNVRISQSISGGGYASSGTSYASYYLTGTVGNYGGFGFISKSDIDADGFGVVGIGIECDGGVSLYNISLDNSQRSSISFNTFDMTMESGGDFSFLTKPSTTYQTSLIIKNTGAVGIGTTSPSEKLDVNGNIKAIDIIDQQGISIYLKLVTVTGNTTITNTFHNKIVRITASCTITIPAGLRTDFNCTFEVIGAYTAQFVDGSGATTSAPFGRYLKTDLTAMFYCTGTASNYRLNGSLAIS